MSGSPEEAHGERRIPLVWEEPADPTVAFVNQFLIQHQPDEFVLTMGQVIAPPVLGDPEDQQAQLARIAYVPVRMLGRYGFTRRRLEELIAILQENLERHDETMKRLRQEGANE